MAHHSAEGVKADADDYVMEMLSGLEENLMRLLTTVRNGIREVQRSTVAQEADRQNPGAEGDGNQ